MIDKQTGLGVLAIVFFILTGAVQEVYLGNLFQSEDPIVVMVFTFGLAAFFFFGLHSRQLPALFRLALTQRKAVIGLNITTLVSWLGFLCSLKTIEPAISGTICFATGPILTTILWNYFRPGVPILPSEKWAAAGLCLGIGILSAATIFRVSSIGDISTRDAAIGLSFAFFSAMGIVGNTFYSKQLSDESFSTTAVMAVRFPLLLIVGALLWPSGSFTQMPMDDFFTKMTLLSVLTVIIPLFALQKGIERCEPITVSLLLASMPVFTFFLQVFDTRLTPSFVSLAGIAICLAFASVGILARLGKSPV